MIVEIDITNSQIAVKVLAIQLESYKVEADLIGYDQLPPLMDSVEKLQACGESFFGFYLDEQLSGVISIKINKNVIDIHRLMVHPRHFKKGIAQKLLEFIENNIKDFESIIVSTGSQNTPAINFYLKNGFSKTGVIEMNENLSITSFEKELK